MKNQDDLFVVEAEDGEWIDASGDGGWSAFTNRAEAQDALDSETDCTQDERHYTIVRFVRERGTPEGEKRI